MSEENLIEHLKKSNNQSTDGGIPSDDKFKQNFYNNKITNVSNRAILYLIELSFGNLNKDATFLRPVQDYSVEHLLPRKWKQVDWPLKDDTDEILKNRKKHINKIGNLTIIASKLNPALSNSAWNIKKEGKSKNSPSLRKNCSGLQSLADCLSKEEWNEDTIDERTDYLFRQAIKIWSSPFEE